MTAESTGKIGLSWDVVAQFPECLNPPRLTLTLPAVPRHSFV
ncbi:MAG: hypothetical protein WA972_12425 [Rhodococcus qingshengii]